MPPRTRKAPTKTRKKPSEAQQARVRKKALKNLKKRGVPAKRMDNKTHFNLRGRRTAKRKSSKA